MTEPQKSEARIQAGIFVDTVENGRVVSSKFIPRSEASEIEHINTILRELVTEFASKDTDGNWWGHDTNLGNQDEVFIQAIDSIQALISQREAEARIDEQKRYNRLGWIPDKAMNSRIKMIREQLGE